MKIENTTIFAPSFKLDIKRNIQEQIEFLIKYSKIIPPELKSGVISELGGKWKDNYYSEMDIINKKMIDRAIGYCSELWVVQNFQIAELWKQTVIQNASINNEPHKVADEVVRQFKESFNLNETQDL